MKKTVVLIVPQTAPPSPPLLPFTCAASAASPSPVLPPLPPLPLRWRRPRRPSSPSCHTPPPPSSPSACATPTTPSSPSSDASAAPSPDARGSGPDRWVAKGPRRPRTVQPRRRLGEGGGRLGSGTRKRPSRRPCGGGPPPGARLRDTPALPPPVAALGAARGAAPRTPRPCDALRAPPFSAPPLSPIRPGRRCHGRPARYGRLLLTCAPHRAGPHGRRGSRRSWKRLLELLPEELTRRVEGHPELPALVEVVMDLGRPPLARFPSGDFLLSHRPISFDDLLHATSQVGDFGADNRARISWTLHRISVIRNRKGVIVGLTCRVGRALTGRANLLQDLVKDGGSLLLIGPPGVGKTTVIREIARMLADDYKKRVMIVDTSNEIGGDGDIPHLGIGNARRLQVPNQEMQHKLKKIGRPSGKSY